MLSKKRYDGDLAEWAIYKEWDSVIKDILS